MDNSKFNYSYQYGNWHSDTAESMQHDIDLARRLFSDHCIFPKHKDSNVLEIGCGMGRFMLMLRDEGYNNLIGVDIDKTQINIAKKSNLNVSLLDGIEYLKNTHKLEIDFFTIWTIKEAYIKMLGKTIFDIKNSIEVDLIEKEVRNADDIFFASFILDDSYIISVCFDTKNEVDLNIQDFNLNMLFAYPTLPNININM